MKTIFLDNASTTKTSEKVNSSVLDILQNDFANPSSLHGLGFSVEKKMNETSYCISKYLGVSPEEIYYTSGGTESNNLAISGAVKARIRNYNHIIVPKTEHPSVIDPINKLKEELGCEVSYVKLDEYGYVDKEDLQNLISEKTALVCIMFTNNETGLIQDITSLGKIVKDKNPNTIFLVDGVQAFGKQKINLKYVDIFTFSSHKIHGLKGVGGIYINKKIRITPLFFGGQQEKSIRPGTQNTLGIICLKTALEECIDNMDENSKYISKLRNLFLEGIKEIDNTRVNSPKEASEYIVNVSFLGVRAETLLHVLEQNGIYVSTSTACSSKKSNKKIVLKSLGYSNEIVESSIRFSFSNENTEEDILYCIDVLKKNVPELRKFQKK